MIQLVIKNFVWKYKMTNSRMHFFRKCIYETQVRKDFMWKKISSLKVLNL